MLAAIQRSSQCRVAPRSYRHRQVPCFENGNNAIEWGRKALREQMTKEEVRQLKKDRFLMLRRQRDLDATEEFLLSGWTENYPLLHDLYSKKERFYEIWEHNNRKNAEMAYESWLKAMKRKIRGFFSELERGIENWHHEIFKALDYQEIKIPDELP